LRKGAPPHLAAAAVHAATKEGVRVAREALRALVARDGVPQGGDLHATLMAAAGPPHTLVSRAASRAGSVGGGARGTSAAGSARSSTVPLKTLSIEI